MVRNNCWGLILTKDLNKKKVCTKIVQEHFSVKRNKKNKIFQVLLAQLLEEQ
jgi:hypothetical protein